MANIPVSRFYPPPFAWEDRVRNGLTPDWRIAQKALLQNHFIVARMRKMFFVKTMRPGSLYQGTSGNNQHWDWSCLTGDEHESGAGVTVKAAALVVPAHTSSATTPRWRIFFGANDSAWRTVPGIASAPTFDDCRYQVVTITGLSPRTQYNCGLDLDDYARVISLAVWEETSHYVNFNASYVSTPNIGYAPDRAITDLQHAEISVDNYHLWTSMGAQLISMCVDNPVTQVWQTSSSSFVNILDASASTTVDANTPGFKPQVQYCNSTETADVNCVFTAYAAAPAGGGDTEVILKDSSGTLGTCSGYGAGTYSWQSAAVVLDGTSNTHKVDVQFRNTAGSGDANVRAFSLYIKDT